MRMTGLQCGDVNAVPLPARRPLHFVASLQSVMNSHAHCSPARLSYAPVEEGIHFRIDALHILDGIVLQPTRSTIATSSACCPMRF
jgi:hypothetical protein